MYSLEIEHIVLESREKSRMVFRASGPRSEITVSSCPILEHLIGPICDATQWVSPSNAVPFTDEPIVFWVIDDARKRFLVDKHIPICKMQTMTTPKHLVFLINFGPINTTSIYGLHAQSCLEATVLRAPLPIFFEMLTVVDYVITFNNLVLFAVRKILNCKHENYTRPICRWIWHTK